MSEPQTSHPLREQFYSELHRREIADLAAFASRHGLDKLTDDLAQDLFLIQIEYQLRNDEPVYEAFLIDSLPQYRACAGAAFQAARLKFTKHANSFIPDPRKTAFGFGEVFLKSTNVVPPDHFQDVDSLDGSSLLPELHLRVTRGPHEGREEIFTGPISVVIGRANDAQFPLPKDNKCSRLHCRIDFRPPQCEITDLNSTNGTFVNGEQIQRTRLVDKDSIQVGNSKFHIYIGAPRRKSGDADSISDSAPRQVADFLIEDQLGEGSFGTVYAAKQVNTEQRVALKLLTKMSLDSPTHVESFVREAAISTRLKHQNIVETFDFGIHNKSPYLVQELVPTIDIFSVLSKLPWKDRCLIVTRVMIEILDGLEFAHCNGVIHRDIKPTNLLFYKCAGGYSAKLADFGLSLRDGSQQPSDVRLAGTVAYMSPEVLIDQKHSSKTCDIYAAGVCLYELLCGGRPYSSAKLTRLVYMILNDPPTPIRERVSQIPETLEEAVTRAMARKSSDRYASAAEFAADLKRRLPSI